MKIEFNISKLLESVLSVDFRYPIGSYYETSDGSFDPNVVWGGIWELEDEGLVHIGAGNTYMLGDEGGEASVQLTSGQSGLPAHVHGLNGHTHSLNNHAHSMSHTHSTISSGGYVVGLPSGFVGENSSAPGGSTIKLIQAAQKSETVGNYNTTGGASSTTTGGNNSQTGGNSNDTTSNVVQDAEEAHNNMQPYIVINRWHRIG